MDLLRVFLSCSDAVGACRALCGSVCRFRSWVLQLCPYALRAAPGGSWGLCVAFLGSGGTLQRLDCSGAPGALWRALCGSVRAPGAFPGYLCRGRRGGPCGAFCALLGVFLAGAVCLAGVYMPFRASTMRCTAFLGWGCCMGTGTALKRLCGPCGVSRGYPGRLHPAGLAVVRSSGPLIGCRCSGFVPGLL